MNKVERAIIMAAGIGSRMQPVTLTTPKPLVKVNGERMIDTIIHALHDNGINEIYVVVGYLKEKFDVLKDEYPEIQIIENPYYNTCNNISSLYVARNHIENAFILDGDQIIYNKEILSPEFDKSGYNAVWIEEPSNEWIMTVQDGCVVDCSRDGGSLGWQLYSISRWNEKDGKQLKLDLEKEFIENKKIDLYWDDIPMFCQKDKYDLGIYKMSKGDIIEIDDYDELTQIDNTYQRMETIYE